MKAFYFYLSIYPLSFSYLYMAIIYESTFFLASVFRFLLSLIFSVSEGEVLSYYGGSKPGGGSSHMEQ